MKRFLIVLCALLIAGCSSQATASSAPVSSVAASSTSESEAVSSESDLSVDKGLLDVIITIPADFGEPLPSDFDAEAYAKENGFKKAVVGDDGSLTITMSKIKHNEMLLETRNGIEKAFKEMVDSDDTPYIKAIKADKDYKLITIGVDKALYEDSFLDLSPMSVSMTAMFYQMLSGGNIKSTVLTKDYKTGETLNTFIFPDDMRAEDAGSSSTPETEAETNQNLDGKIGRRKNPAKINDTVTPTLDNLAQFEITLLSVKRGEDALTDIMAENSFNVPPAEGNEYILATFKFKNIKDLSTNDTPLQVSEFDFSFSDASFAKKSIPITMTVVPNALNSELFEGAETIGNILFECKKGDSPYAIYRDTIWFNISGE